MLPFLSADFGNASSIHAFGQRARAAVETAREQVAALIRAHPQEIVFTSGGTESDNQAIFGVAQARIVAGSLGPKIQHKLLSAILGFKYSPAKLGGTPIASQLDLVVHVPS